MHHLLLLLLPELHLHNACWLEYAASRLDICVHLHLLRVDGGVNDNPRSSPQLSTRRDVDKHRMLVLDQGVDDVGSKLEHFTVHVPSATREAAPICKDDERQVLTIVEVTNGSCCLEGAVWEPDLASLRFDDLLTRWVCRVGGDFPLNVSRLDSNHAERHTAQLGTPNDDAPAPALKVFLKAPIIEKATQLLAFWCDCAGQHVPRIIGRLAGRECHIALHRVCCVKKRWAGPDVLRHEGQPVNNGSHSLLVTLHQLVRYAVGNHDLWATKLVLG
mmetsp:Transcript_16149/g.37808  ORF Transcript_16149/g.37808 Transcript_16149/m.37808 type:complete len:274 (-) Transcript_16149:2081-2902(-)